MPDTEPLHDRVVTAALHNAELPISRLPPEILHAIFAILSTIDPLGFSTRQRSLAFVLVTHVCQRWRHIALHQPTLWAHHIFLPFPRGNRWLDAFLTRARDAPLKVDASCEVQPPMSPSDRVQLSAIVARTQVLHLRSFRPIFPTLSYPAPLLHTLEVHQSLNSPNFMLSEELLGGPAGTPHLRHLEVFTWTALPWTWSRLEQLVSIKFIQHTGSEDFSEALSALGRMRALEKLVLYLTLTTVNEEPRPVVALEKMRHKMRHVTLYMHPADARCLLTHLALPTDVCISCHLLRGNGVELDAFSSALSAFFPALSACISTRASPIVRVHVESAANGQRVRVKAWRTGDVHGAPAADVAVHGQAHGPTLAQAALETFATEHLEELAVRCAVHGSMWLALLARASRLRCIVLEDAGAAHSLCAALGRAAGFLPALSNLVVAGVNFKWPWVGGDGTVGMLANTLPLCLVERARAGHALGSLDVVGCDVDEAWARELEERIPELVVRWCREEGGGGFEA
ncbi:hypothetical protein FA95DRAFT_1563477 [Auriscalpium vulgare]|uniref:Uncharacterized protein n=1 Tax=Auriscalpium vulgare TaxID=40419 RepID=A0ACB8RGJ1_9AGAM|nr:hypothetical protein FA95DRAFT_1563477 [Auriscalpium vulgare]